MRERILLPDLKALRKKIKPSSTDEGDGAQRLNISIDLN